MIKTCTKVLNNGLRLILAEDKTKNRTSVELSVKYGGLTKNVKINNEKVVIPDGLAHLLEHSIIENSIYGDIHKYFQNKYVDYNGFTSFNTTRYVISCVDHFYDNLEVLIRYVNIAKFDEEKIEEIKKPVIEEIKRGLDRPNYHSTIKSFEKVFNNHKYKGNLGTEKDIKNIDANLLKLIHDTFYQPKNEILLISGNFDTKKVIEKIENIYSNIEFSGYDFEVIDKKDRIKLDKSENVVIDDKFEEFVSFTINLDISKLSSKEKVKLDFYLDHFLRYNFDESSNAYRYIRDNKISKYSIETSSENIINDCLTVDIKMIGTDKDEFIKIVLDILNNKYSDKEMFELWKKDQIIKMIFRKYTPHKVAKCFYGNIVYYDYQKEDTLSDMEELNFEEYNNILKRLDFINYFIVTQKKK